MPIFKADGRLVYYAHVPRCAGGALGRYVRARFGPVAFEDRTHARQPAAARWSRTSPQHVSRDSLARLFPRGFFDASFAVVRHPTDRLVSAYRFHREVEGTIPEKTDFSEWLDDVADLIEETPFAFDNHIRPMDDIVPSEAQVFHLEDGFAPVVAWLDTLGGGRADADGPAASTPAPPSTPPAADTPGPDITRYDRDLIARLYAADFARFGYDPEARARGAAPDPPAARRLWTRR